MARRLTEMEAMTSRYIEEQSIIVGMASALRKIDDISDDSKRAGAYISACVSPENMVKFDREALLSERWRRAIEFVWPKRETDD